MELPVVWGWYYYGNQCVRITFLFYYCTKQIEDLNKNHNLPVQLLQIIQKLRRQLLLNNIMY